MKHLESYAKLLRTFCRQLGATGWDSPSEMGMIDPDVHFSKITISIQ